MVYRIDYTVITGITIGTKLTHKRNLKLGIKKILLNDELTKMSLLI